MFGESRYKAVNSAKQTRKIEPKSHRMAETNCCWSDPSWTSTPVEVHWSPCQLNAKMSSCRLTCSYEWSFFWKHKRQDLSNSRFLSCSYNVMQNSSSYSLNNIYWRNGEVYMQHHNLTHGRANLSAGVSGCSWAQKLLSATCLQGPSPGRRPLQRQPLPTSQVLLPVLRWGCRVRIRGHHVQLTDAIN